MPLTEEQAAVIAADAPILKVNAVAGSGKTTTLLEFAAARPRSRILYLAYNRAVADEVRLKAHGRGLSHMTVKTLHGLAYQYVQGHNYQLESELNEWRLLEQYVPSAERQGEDALIYAWLIKDLTNYYLNAAWVKLDDGLLDAYREATAPTAPVRVLLAMCGSELLAVVRSLLSDMRQRRIPALHDFYLKLFQFAKVKLPFDIILVDEAQDTSGVMLSIIQRQDHAQRVFVGDGFQQIYAFRHAVNSLERIDGQSHPLSQTFRFGDKLAQHLAEQVNAAYRILGEPHRLHMRGTAAETHFKPRPDLARKRSVAVICRSNLALFEAALERLEKGAKSMYFEGGYGGYNFMNSRVVSLLNLKLGKRQKIEDPLIRKLAHFEDVRRFAKDTQNAALATLVDLVGRYGTKLYEFDREIKARLVDKPQAAALFATTHKAKGQEYDWVAMGEDGFATRKELEKLMDMAEEFNPAKLREEINVYYVAATRARKGIRLAPF
ncbi:UvrD-helicase domain-containing protein [Methylomagnum ishizawai]|uniref:UvrD-helicase domain-containing protein n=1 Tax=Methylomagnum ishizawai TaxID=1760988 RepID=UPI001C337A39|nr:UvrD-helicase domain-containing protein [Methylomagnum ishizawai]BBL74582.1 DNA helicase [Methylomagnum ishizawai]